jgi:hypothetical protein
MEEGLGMSYHIVALSSFLYRQDRKRDVIRLA